MKINTHRIIMFVSVLAFALAISGSVLAQTFTNGNGTVYNVPAGYTNYQYGIHYNSTLGMYYNPMTGQFSTTAPSGPASLNSAGQYIIPAGYNFSLYGTYYNPSTGVYYDPATGFYSVGEPAGPSYFGTTPGLPNTGAGGNAALTATLLAITGALAVGGMALVRRNAALGRR